MSKFPCVFRAHICKLLAQYHKTLVLHWFKIQSADAAAEIALQGQLLQLALWFQLVAGHALVFCPVCGHSGSGLTGSCCVRQRFSGHTRGSSWDNWLNLRLHRCACGFARNYRCPVNQFGLFLCVVQGPERHIGTDRNVKASIRLSLIKCAIELKANDHWETWRIGERRESWFSRAIVQMTTVFLIMMIRSQRVRSISRLERGVKVMICCATLRIVFAAATSIREAIQSVPWRWEWILRDRFRSENEV